MDTVANRHTQKSCQVQDCEDMSSSVVQFSVYFQPTGFVCSFDTMPCLINYCLINYLTCIQRHSSAPMHFQEYGRQQAQATVMPGTGCRRQYVSLLGFVLHYVMLINVRACVRTCVRACVRACVHACAKVQSHVIISCKLTK
jgi:hypothetical protein